VIGATEAPRQHVVHVGGDPLAPWILEAASVVVTLEDGAA
jgi:hypothetical protein